MDKIVMARNYKSCDLIADFYLLQLDPMAGDSITNLKMQKLCYYAQGWHLAMYDTSLFDETLQAWAHGPVVPDLYRRFNRYGWQAIDPRDLKTDPMQDLQLEEQTFIRNIWNMYRRFSGKELETMTHSEAPWKNAYKPATPQGRCNEEISYEAMRAFFGPQLVRSNP